MGSGVQELWEVEGGVGEGWTGTNLLSHEF